MDRSFLRSFRNLEREVGRLKVLERLVPETMGISASLGATALRGLWPMSSVDSSGDALDISGHGRTLTYNGDPTYNFDNDIGSYIALDGTGDFLSRNDEADLDITGTEAYVGSNGLTVWGWTYYDNAVGSVEGIMSKWDAGGNQQSYQMYRDATGDFNFEVSVDGSATTNVDVTTSLVTVDTWYFVAGRFDPSTELKAWVNTETNTNTTSIPASIFSGTANFYLGAVNGANLATGRVGLCGICASALSDKSVGMIFEMTRGMYGV